MHPKPDLMAEWIMRYGVGFVLVSIVLVLLFMYFWKIITSPPKYVELFKNVGQVLGKLETAITKNTHILIEVRTLLNGRTRNNREEDEFD